MKLLAACTFLAVAGIVAAQQPADPPAFEVASIKASDPNPTNPMWIGMDADGGMVRYTNITLKDCIRAAYRVRDFQLQGPAWISDARFEIIAKLGNGTQEQIPEMLQTLLAERFKVTVRHDMKEQSVYALVVAKDAVTSLKPAKPAPEGKEKALTALGLDGKPRQAMQYAWLPSGIRISAPAANLPSFVDLMSRFTERPVIDMTGLTGLYDLALTFTPETLSGIPGGGASDSFKSEFPEPGPSIFDAVQQYGLKLEPRKAPVEVLTVTHAEKTPTEN